MGIKKDLKETLKLMPTMMLAIVTVAYITSLSVDRNLISLQAGTVISTILLIAFGFFLVSRKSNL